MKEIGLEEDSQRPKGEKSITGLASVQGLGGPENLGIIFQAVGSSRQRAVTCTEFEFLLFLLTSTVGVYIKREVSTA